MKSLIILLGLGVTFLFAKPNFESNKVNLVSVETNTKCHYGQCNATARSTGNRCKHCVSNSGDRYCWQHK